MKTEEVRDDPTFDWTDWEETHSCNQAAMGAREDEHSAVGNDGYDDHSESNEWRGGHSRIWTAHRARNQGDVVAFIRPAEAELVITNHLMLLRDLGGIHVLTSNPTEMGLRLYAMERIRAFVQADFVTEHEVNIMSRLIVGEDMFQSDDDDSLGMEDLDFDIGGGRGGPKY